MTTEISSAYFIKQVCPVCESSNARVLYGNILHTCHVLEKAGVPVKNAEAPADILECNNCGHSYLSHMVKDEIISHYYNAVNSEYYDTVKNKPYDRRAADTKKFAGLIEEKCRGAKTVLEIGSGMGYLLNQLKLKGFECYGVEPSQFASGYARDNFGLNIITALLTGTTYPGKKFDIIILSDVVEHVSNINGLFALAQNYLADNGKIVVLTGNRNSLYSKICGKKWLYYFSWEHVSFFNKNSVTALFKRHGLVLDYFKKTQHTGSAARNIKIVAYTFYAMLRHFLKIRREDYYYMAFDHFIAIAKKG